MLEPRSWACLAHLKCTASPPPHCGREPTEWGFQHQRRKLHPNHGQMRTCNCKQDYRVLWNEHINWNIFQGSGGSAQEGDLCKQGVQGVQDPQLHTLQDCEEGGDRTCPTFQCCCYNLESGEKILNCHIFSMFSLQGWFEHGSGSNQRRNASAEGCYRVRDTKWHIVREM